MSGTVLKLKEYFVVLRNSFLPPQPVSGVPQGFVQEQVMHKNLNYVPFFLMKLLNCLFYFLHNHSKIDDKIY